MFTCVAYYLNDGIAQLDNSVAMARKHIKLNFGEELMDYLDEINTFGYMHFKDMYNDFLKRNDYEKKEYSSKRFSRAIEEGCERLGWLFEKRKNSQTRLPEVQITKGAI